MSEFDFSCTHCGQRSGYGRKAGQAEAASSNPYAKQTRKYRCEACSRINDVQNSAYDWSRIDRES